MDRRRVFGPELSVAPIIEREDSDMTEVQRRDRRPEDIRPIFLKTGLINQANGSAYIEMNQTKIACGVYGPRQSKRPSFSGKGKLNCEVKFSTFSCPKRRGHQQDAQEKELSAFLTQALSPAVRLELFPKSTVDIFIHILQNDGTASCLAGCITAASVALADAGVEMVDMVAACSACFINDTIYMDCSLQEESHVTGSLVVAYMPTLRELTHVWQEGQVTLERTEQAVEQCIGACTKIARVMRTALMSSLH
ncbi:uncharacterized protein VTP21DRAFT_4257 [Calcarisporiella thermophila]|uniref:uncharacterized protein n=1 Tax=Calcarisporiella thermophila TaxID=911321 RepID=UPI00374454B1